MRTVTFFLFVFLLVMPVTQMAVCARESSGQSSGQSAEEAQKRLERIEADIKISLARRQQFKETAKDAVEKAKNLSEKLVEYSKRQRQLEYEISRLKNRLADLSDMESDLTGELELGEESLVQLIAALERLGRRPAALSLFQPGSALETAQSVSVISTMVPLVNAKAIKLRSDLQGMLRVKTEMDRERVALAQTSDDMIKARLVTEKLIAERRDQASKAQEYLGAESVRLSNLKAEAQDLQGLLDGIFRLKPVARPSNPDRPQKNLAPPNAPVLLSAKAFKKHRGELIPPVVGQEMLGFGDQDGALTSKGIKWRTTFGAQVLAPFAGRILFAAPFRDFGQVLIIEHAEGYHSLLAGLSSSYADVGQSVLAGEPVGVMTMEAGTVEPSLYLELRQGGKSVNPAPWYRTN